MKRFILFASVFLIPVSIIFAQAKKKGKAGAKSSNTAAAAAAAAQAEQDRLAKEKADAEAKRLEEDANRAKAEAEREKRTLREIKSDNYNQYSYRAILDKDIMFKKTVWRRLDLKEKQNKAFMTSGRELPTLIMEYIKRGKIKAYSSDSLDDGKVLTMDEFKAKLKDPNAGDIGDTAGMSADEIKQLLGQNTDIDTKLMTLVDLKEDVIFDRKRSRMYYDIMSITVYIPASLNPRGFDMPVATVKYKELADNFKKDKRAAWFNRENDAEHRNYVDAFDLRLFNSFLIKVSNPEDELIIDTYGGDQRAGRYGAEKAAMDLLEYENNLWEF